MSRVTLDKFQAEAQLRGILVTYSLRKVLPIPDGALSFSHRQVLKLVRWCLIKFYQDSLTIEYLEDFKTNIKTLLQQAEEKSQNGDLAAFKQLAEKILHIVGQLTGSLDDLETTEGDPDVPDGDVTEETTTLTNTDGGTYEIPEIDGSTIGISSVTPGRVPCKRDYETSKLVSSGNFGAVYLVQHKDTQKTFAMKKIDKQNLMKPGRLKRVFLERDILAFSECPFIVSMICSFTTKHHLCMVMEYVGGGDCGALLLDRGILSVPLARMYFAKTVLAIEHLHSNGIIHRDLKPDNLLITTRGHIKVTDFGLSKLGQMRPLENTYKAPREDVTKEFLDKEFCGTPYYIAPEVISHTGYGRPIDWWSLGVILFRFITGAVPFDGLDSQDFYHSIMYGDIPWGCYVDPDAKDIITKLLIKDPEYRLGTGGANDIKIHPFLKDLDLNNMLSQKPEYVPQVSSDTDTSYFVTRDERYRHMASEEEEEEDTGEDSHCEMFKHFLSSTRRLNKLYDTVPETVNAEDPGPSPKGSMGDGSEDGAEERTADNKVVIAVDDTGDEALESAVDDDSNSDNQQLSASTNVTSEVSATVIGRFLSSCRRRLSRAARAIRRHCLFGCCHPISRSPSRQASSSSSWGEGIDKPWSGIPHCPSTVV